jgi:CheY-like chemotaxis protein
MSRQNRQSIMAEGLDACDRLQPSDEVSEARPDGDWIKFSLPARRSLRVLVADDNRDAADSLSILVKMWGHDVRQTYDGAAALEMASAYRPDVLLLDISMPKMNGCHLAQQLRREARFTDALLIAITGWGDKANRLLGEEAGFDHFFTKPVDLSILEELLLLQQHRLAEPEACRTLAPAVKRELETTHEIFSGVLCPQGRRGLPPRCTKRQDSRVGR